jgi:hypothetical protein
VGAARARATDDGRATRAARDGRRQATVAGSGRAHAQYALHGSTALDPQNMRAAATEAYGISTAPDERGGAPSSARAADPTINTRYYTSHFGIPSYKVFAHCLPSSPIHASLHSTHERAYQYKKHQVSSKTGMQMGCRATPKHMGKNLSNTPTSSTARPSPTACDMQEHSYEINLDRKGYSDMSSSRGPHHHNAPLNLILFWDSLYKVFVHCVPWQPHAGQCVVVKTGNRQKRASFYAAMATTFD